ncbi:MAG: 1,3-beta-galactosyl-N-acetylhexosamine phosphorylase [Kiritimatiellae bacterium]|nr:1,3-beta-galactosyl-N-acetylhexosamine phosphorylase [Kiritimatiellia bacterium]
MSTPIGPCWENGFTIPGQSGHMERVLELAKQWGADAIRSSDGADLPPSVAESGYQVYSNVYLIRKDNEWISRHPHVLQQLFKTSPFVQAQETEGPFVINIMDGYNREMYRPNGNTDALPHWQVFDRTTGDLLDPGDWRYDETRQSVVIDKVAPWHFYSVSFLAYNTWDVIHWYNHTVNNWDDEPQMPMDPIYPEVRERIEQNLAKWLETNAYVDVVRFTSFYYLNHGGGICDYSQTVSPRALALFKEKYGTMPTAESFIREGAYNHSAQVPDPVYKQWMAFIHDFFMEISGPYIDMVHDAGKKAVIFLGDQWIGSEPYAPDFKTLKMDGAIAAVFNGFETRLVGDLTSVPVKEIRFHPYFFPKEVTGKPTFSEGGEPLNDLQTYWRDVRRACLRVTINRISFGGIISLLDGYPDFVDYVGEVSRQARRIAACHLEGAPWKAPVKAAVLCEWGQLRAWIYRGRMRYNSIYNNLLEALAGLPVDVRFLSFDEVLESGVPADVDVVINCGKAGTSWSGGERWGDPRLETALFRFVHNGGGFIGMGEPSALKGGGRFFRMAPVLGVDREPVLIQENVDFKSFCRDGHFIVSDADGPLDLLDETVNLKPFTQQAEVVSWRRIAECDHFYDYLRPQLVVNGYGAGRGVYFSGFKYDAMNSRVLARALYWAAGKEQQWTAWQSDNPFLECAWFPAARKLIVVNNSHQTQKGTITGDDGQMYPIELSMLDMSETDV